MSLKWFLRVALLIVVAAASSGSVSVGHTWLTASAKVIGEDGTFEVTIPEEVAHDILKIVDFALENDSAREVSERDFNHCHVLISRDARSARFGEHLQTVNTALSDYTGLLCHTQELVIHDDNKRNIVMWKGSYPFLLSPPFAEDLGTDRDNLGQNARTTANAPDLGPDVVIAADIVFAVSEYGGYRFEIFCICS